MYTTEFVTPKHPDKMCDRIADRALDAIKAIDKNARVALEMVAGHGNFYVVGEVTADGVDSATAKKLLKASIEKVSGDASPVFESKLAVQSPDIAQGVDAGGAGDQGIMVGYACRDNAEMIPQEHKLARELAQYLYEKYQTDGKVQITTGSDFSITAVVASFQNTTQEELKGDVRQWLTEQKTIPLEFVKIYANPAGDWTMGGFDADSGMNGRKLVVDAYGTRVPLGGGAFSGKDETKTDRSGAYMARHIAVKLLGAHPWMKDVTVKLAYAIGVAEPVDIFGEATDTAGMRMPITREMVLQVVTAEEMTPRGIIEKFNLQEQNYEETAEWGAFGRGFAWDKIEL